MQGRCLCNSVRFELRSEIQGSYYCHCRDCQIQSGSAYHVLGIVSNGSIDLVMGRVAEFTQSSASGYDMTREFCPRCGTPLFIRSTRFPDIQMFMLSALLDPESIKPTFQIWCNSKLPWAEIRRDLSCFPEGGLDMNT